MRTRSSIHALLCTALSSALLPLQGLTQSPTAIDRLGIVNNNVTTMEEWGDTVILGGTFDRAGRNMAYGVSFDLAEGTVQPMPLFDGSVSFVSSDGVGGWYVSGHYQRINGVSESAMVHIAADGSYTAMDDAIGSPLAMATWGDTLFFATLIGLQAVDAGTGALLDWGPSGSTMGTRSVAVSGNRLYISGDFSSFGGQSRNNLACINIGTGTVNGWNPNANDPVEHLLIKGDSIIAIGDFTTIGGQARDGIALLDNISGAPYPWAPTCSGPITDAAVDGDRLFISGQFGQVDGQTRTALASWDLTSGSLDGWAPVLAYMVNEIEIVNGTVYISPNLMGLDAVTGLPTDWTVQQPDGFVAALATSGDRIMVGGGFRYCGPLTRQHIAAMDFTSGEHLEWPVSANGPVAVMERQGTTLYLAGTFTQVNGTPRAGLAAVDIPSGALLPWAPEVNGAITSIVANGDRIHIAGNFTEIGGLPRNRLGAVEATTGSTLPWNPFPSNVIHDMVLANGLLYVCGPFSTIGGEAISCLAALDPVSGAATTWTPITSGSPDIHTLVVYGNTVFVGGHFLSIADQPRDHLAAFSTVSGALLPFAPELNAQVRDLAARYGVLYAVGDFNQVAGNIFDEAASFNISTGALRDWRPRVDDPSGENTILASMVFAGNNALFVAGGFTRVQYLPRSFFAGFDHELTTSMDLVHGSGTDAGVLPNPTTGRITIVGMEAGQRIILRNALGQVQGQWSVDSGTYTLELPSTATGILLLNILSREGRLVRSDRIVRVQ